MSRPSKLLARRAMHGLRKQISSLYERKTTCDKPGGRYVAKMTPVGFEPTPFRNGALSHRLRPLGQSVLEMKAYCLDPWAHRSKSNVMVATVRTRNPTWACSAQDATS